MKKSKIKQRVKMLYTLSCVLLGLAVFAFFVFSISSFLKTNFSIDVGAISFFLFVFIAHFGLICRAIAYETRIENNICQSEVGL